jgi:tetratricopeptide (TPR) repeat protein
MQYWRAKYLGSRVEQPKPDIETLKIYAKDARIHYDLGWLFFQTDREAARFHFSRAREINRQWALPHYALAKVRWDEADRERDKTLKRIKFDEIISNLTQAFILDGNLYHAFADRGLAYAKIGKHKEAIVDGQKAVALQPSSAYAHYALGFAYYQAGRNEYPKAKRELEDALLLEVDKLPPEMRRLVEQWLADINRRR